MKNKLTALITTCILSLSLTTSTVSAHTIIGGNEKYTKYALEKIENYYIKKDNLKLDHDLIIINLPGEKAMLTELEKHNIKNAQRIASTAQAVTSKNNAILINTYNLTDQEYLFYLAHEVTHQYQHQLLKENFLNDMVYLEGTADIMASRISGMPIEKRDFKIPYETISTYTGFNNYPKSPQQVLQARYYMKNQKSLLSVPENSKKSNTNDSIF